MPHQIKSPRPLHAALDCEHFPVTDKQTEKKIKNLGLYSMCHGDSALTDRRYQTYYLPCFAVDKNRTCSLFKTLLLVINQLLL